MSCEPIMDPHTFYTTINLLFSRSCLNAVDACRLARVNVDMMTLGKTWINTWHDSFNIDCKRMRKGKTLLRSPLPPKPISFTDSKKKYKLNDEELSKLDMYETVHRKYRHTIRFYRECDVRAMSLVKFNGAPPSAARGGTNKAREKREQQLAKLLGDPRFVGLSSVYKSLPVTNGFLQSGSVGIRKLTSCFGQHPTMVGFLRGLGLDDKEISMYVDKHLEAFVDDLETTQRNIERTVEASRQRDARKNALAAALETCGLSLRKDSRLCETWIDTGFGNMSEIVLIMRQMDFLHANTEYPKIMRRMLNEAYEESKQWIREIHGFIRDPDAYQELLDEDVDRDAISAAAKQKAINMFKKKRGSLPEWWFGAA